MSEWHACTPTRIQQSLPLILCAPQLSGVMTLQASRIPRRGMSAWSTTAQLPINATTASLVNSKYGRVDWMVCGKGRNQHAKVWMGLRVSCELINEKLTLIPVIFMRLRCGHLWHV